MNEKTVKYLFTKVTTDEVSEYQKFRRRKNIVENKKGKGSYKRSKFKNNKENE